MRRCRLLVLSPHPDDAVWSIGGILPRVRRRCEAVVITVFDGDAPAAVKARLEETLESWRVVGSPLLRRREDERALSRLGVRRLGLGFVDAALRTSGSGRFAYEDQRALFLTDPEAEQGLIDRLAAALADYVEGSDVLAVPLGLGGHVDHRVVRGAAERLRRRAVYYEDFPYVSDNQADQFAALRSSGARQWSLPANWPIWVEASLLYRSQVLRLFGGEERFRQTLLDHAGSVERASIRIWRTASS